MKKSKINMHEIGAGRRQKPISSEENDEFYFDLDIIGTGFAEDQQKKKHAGERHVKRPLQDERTAYSSRALCMPRDHTRLNQAFADKLGRFQAHLNFKWRGLPPDI